MTDNRFLDVIPGQVESVRRVSFQEGTDLNADAEIMEITQVERDSKKDLRSCWGGADKAAGHEHLVVDFEEEFDAAMNDLRNRLGSMIQRHFAKPMQPRLDGNHMPSPAPPPFDSEPQAPKLTNDKQNLTEEPSYQVQVVKPNYVTNSDTMEYDTMSNGLSNVELQEAKQSKNISSSMVFTSQTTKRLRQAERFSDLERERRTKSMAQCRIDVELLKELMEEDDDSKLALLRSFVKSNTFEALAAFMLFTNITVLGVQVEMQGNNLDQGEMKTFRTINTLYCVIFLLELILRIYAHGWLKYFFTRDSFWSWLDLVVVAMQIIEIAIIFAFQSTSSTLSFVGRLIRVARVCRVVRAIRVMRFLRGFKVLIDAILATVKHCVWALVLLGIILFVFAIIFAQFTSDFLAQHLDAVEEYATLTYYFGNFTKSIFTLFKAIVGGIDWEISANELSNVGDMFVVLFVIYVTLMQFVVINVIAGLFLQSAIEQAQQDHDHVIQLRLQQKQQYVEKLKSLFRILDASHDGGISLVEFEENLKRDEVQAFFESLEIEHADAWTIFKLLDTDGGGTVNYEEFVDGCIRLKGNAKSIDVAQLMYHHKWIMDKVCEVAEYLEENLRVSQRVSQALNSKSSLTSDSAEESN